MHRSAKEIKRISRENLLGHYQIPMGAFIVSSLITLAIELPFSMFLGDNPSVVQTITSYVAEFLISLIGIVLSAGQLKIHLNMARKREYLSSQLFDCFKQHPDRYLISGFILSLISVICALPFVGVAYLYSQNPTVSILFLGIAVGLLSLILIVYIQLRFQFVYFILLEHDQMGIRDSFSVASGLMKGNILRLFGILISFVGLEILCLLSLGIGSLWVAPYQMQTLTIFYLDLIGELPSKEATPVNTQPNFFNQYI